MIPIEDRKQPALALPTPVRIVCREGPLEQLAGELATHALDLVVSDSPMAPVLRIKAYNHLLGESTVTLMAEKKMAASYKARFPTSLDGAPFLLPTEAKMLRRVLDQWFDGEGIRPRVVGEFDDSALLKTFGQGGAGVFAVPTAIEPETARQYGAAVIGRLDGIRLRYFAISVERRLKHPAVVAVSEGLRNTPAVARSSYIDPLVIEHYRRGRTAALSRGRVSDAALVELLG